MKHIIEFDLPDDHDDLKIAIQARDLYSVLWDFDQWLRHEIKHNDKPYEEIRERLYDFMNNFEVRL